MISALGENAPERLASGIKILAKESGHCYQWSRVLKKVPEGKWAELSYLEKYLESKKSIFSKSM